jgi:uncharacterized membrane protein YjdF
MLPAMARQITPRSIPQGKLGLGLFTGAYLLAASGRAALTGNTEFIFYIVVMVILIAIILAIDAKVRFSATALWMLAIWGLLHMAGGTIPVEPARVSADAKPVLYSLWLVPGLLKYDQVVHFYGFATATIAAWECLATALRPGARMGIGLATGAALMGMGLGAANEVIEFAATRMMDTNVGGYDNTGWDLVANMLGAMSAAAYLALARRA